MLKRNLIGWMAAAAFAGLAAVAHAGEAAYREQGSTVAGVTVSVTPPDFAAADWDFVVSLQTHVRDLGDDLRESAQLVANGRRYAPVSWNGAAPGGHHRKGVLRFKAITPRPAAVELQIKLAGESAPRSFEWQLK